jgi:hypothetical protein
MVGTSDVLCLHCVELVVADGQRWLSLHAIFGASNDGHQPVPAMSFVCIK